MSLVSVTWLARSAPLSPCACLARGPRARLLGARLLAYEDARLSRLTACAGDRLQDISADTLLVLGPEDALPWLDGLLYLGRDTRAPRLLLPTQLAPSVPLELLSRALAAELAKSQHGELALQEGALFPMDDRAEGALGWVPVTRTSPVTRTILATWMSAS